VAGEAALPDKTEVQLELGFKFPRGKFTREQSLATVQTSVTKKTFAATIGPFRDRRLLAGEYFVEVRARGDLGARAFQSFGDAKAREDAEKEFRAHHVELAKTIERLQRDPDSATLRDL